MIILPGKLFSAAAQPPRGCGVDSFAPNGAIGLAVAARGGPDTANESLA
jgi:hypothetical protein